MLKAGNKGGQISSRHIGGCAAMGVRMRLCFHLLVGGTFVQGRSIAVLYPRRCSFLLPPYDLQAMHENSLARARATTTRGVSIPHRAAASSRNRSTTLKEAVLALLCPIPIKHANPSVERASPDLRVGQARRAVQGRLTGHPCLPGACYPSKPNIRRGTAYLTATDACTSS